MNITINDKRYKIRQSNTLTVAEYLALMENSQINIANYLQVVTGEDFKTILKTTANENSVRTLKNYIGEIKTAADFANGSFKEFDILGKTYKAKKMDWQAVGTRIMFEQRINKTQNMYALAVYILAVLIEGNFEAEASEEVYQKLLKENYLDVMPSAVFFFAKLNRGYLNDKKLLKVLKIIARDLTKSFGSQQGFHA